MNRFVRLVFLVMLLASGLGFGLLAYSNAQSDKDRRQRIRDEEGTIAATYKRLDQQAMHAVFTVEKQEVSMVAHGEPPMETWGKEMTSTTLIFGLCESDFQTPKYVERIVIPGDTVTLAGIRLELKASPEVAGVLAGHVFYLFDTVGGGAGEEDPYELNPLGYPPMGLRHTRPGFTDYEKQLWRPVWDMMLADEKGRGAGPANRPVVRTKLPAASLLLAPGQLYKASVGASGVRILPAEGGMDIREVMVGMLRLARSQDEDAALGISHNPAEVRAPK